VKKNNHTGKIVQPATKCTLAEMVVLRAQLEEKQKELEALQEAAMLGLAEIEVDEEELVAHKKATAIRRFSDMQLYDAGNNISGSDKGCKDMEIDSGEFDDMKADESDKPVPKAKKVP
jgi:hypothetical protein